MAEAKKEEEIAGQIEVYRALYASIRRQLEVLSAALSELSVTREALRSMKEIKAGTELLVPIGGETFLKARLESNEKVLVGLGADASVEKSTDDAILTLSERSRTIENALNEAIEKLQKLRADIDSLEQAMRERKPKE